jgi:asparagine synthase (glutamine-hydrolysing)
LHVPLFEHARGGSVLTGVGGDEPFVAWRWRALADQRSGRARRSARVTLDRVYSRAPVGLRARRNARRHTPDSAAWLSPGAVAAVRRLDARETAEDPARFDEHVVWRLRTRHLALGLQGLEQLAADAGARVISPLADPAFVAALATAGGRDGFGIRQAAYAATLPGLLPNALRTRRDKATFDQAFWTLTARRFAESWDGRGLDERLIDPQRLRAVWRGAPGASPALLIQAAAVAAMADTPGTAPRAPA